MKDFGIDKIHLTTRDFDVKNCGTNDFAIDHSIKQGGKHPPRLLTDQAGHEIEAWKVYHNGKLGNYTISEYGLLVTFNPSKIANQNSPHLLVSTQDRGFHDALSGIEKEMKEIGIITNLDEMKLTRVDVAAQDEMTYRVFEYQPVFRSWKMKRAKNQREYEGGYLYGNGQHQTMFYDKKGEMETQGLGALVSEVNLMRGEIRVLKRESVGSIFKTDRLNGLRAYTDQELRDIYKSYLNKNLFAMRKAGEQLVFEFDSLAGMLAEYRKFRNGWMLFLLEVNLDLLLVGIGGMNVFGRLLEAGGYDRTTAWKIKKRVEGMRNRKAVIDSKLGKVSVSTLMAEVQEKFAA